MRQTGLMDEAGGAAFYALLWVTCTVLAFAGVFVGEELHTYMQPLSRLDGHPTNHVPGIEGKEYRTTGPHPWSRSAPSSSSHSPILSSVSRLDQPVRANVVLTTTNANGGEYDLISSIVVWYGYPGIKREIPTILADDGISLGQVSANSCCTWRAMAFADLLTLYKRSTCLTNL